MLLSGRLRLDPWEDEGPQALRTTLPSGDIPFVGKLHRKQGSQGTKPLPPSVQPPDSRT